MKDYGRVQSTVKPPEVDVRETKVFVASNIKDVTTPETDGQPGFTGYEYDLKEYEKDEYIHMLHEKTSQLEDEATNLQIALCDVYEMLA